MQRVVKFITLGCKVNQYETNAMAQKFLEKGYKVIEEYEQNGEKPDICIINTCTVTNMSDRKSRQMLRREKENNKNVIVVAVGCYAQVAKNELNKIPEIDLVLGNNEKVDIVKYVEDYINENENNIEIEDVMQSRLFSDFGDITFTEKTRAVVKIQDGCDRFCSYCIIPYARGRVRSRKPESIISEITKIAEKDIKEAGFEGIVLTSHYIEDYYQTDVPERDMWVKAISENLGAKGIDIDLYLGNEVYMTENMMQLLIDGKASTINNSCYVLFEMPLNVEPMNLYDVIYSLQEHKLIPILAHPERYTFVQKEPELITDLIEKGVLMQANYASILGYYGEKAQYIVTKFFEHNMIHFLGSDVHRQNTIYKMIPQAMEKIEEIVGANKLEELTTINPKLAVNNKRIEIEEPEELTLTWKEKLMMFIKR